MDLWASKPLAPQIQHDHPLARGLMFCVVPMSRSASFLDLCSGMRGASTGVVAADAVANRYGEGYNFGTNTDRVEFGSWGRFDFTGAPGYSMAAWILFNGTDNTFVLNKKATAAGNGWGIRLSSADKVECRHDGTSVVSSATVSLAVPTMVMTAWDGTTGYAGVNGKIDNSGALSAPTASGSALRIGALPTNTVGNFGAFYGAMVWKRVLTRGEWRWLYANPWAVVRPASMEMIRSMTEFYYAGVAPASGAAKPFISLDGSILTSGTLGGM